MRSSSLASQPLGAFSLKGTSGYLRQAPAYPALSLVPCHYFAGLLSLKPFLPSLSSLHSLTSHWHLVTLEAGFWMQPHSFPFIPLPFQEIVLSGLVQQEAVVLRWDQVS